MVIIISKLLHKNINFRKFTATLKQTNLATKAEIS